MTLAIDTRTDRVIGQLVSEGIIALDDDTTKFVYTLLTRDGYRDVPRSSVRLEVVR